MDDPKTFFSDPEEEDLVAAGAVCVYANAASWSDCDPESMLRSKSVKLKRSSNDGTSRSDGDCPRTRILTKDCKIRELPRGDLFRSRCK